MKFVFAFVFLLASVEASAKCWAAKNDDGEIVKIEATKRPKHALGQAPCETHIKILIPLIAEQECEDCIPEGCDESEVLRGDRDEDGVKEAWCIGPTKYVVDAAKKAQAEAEKLAAENASKTKGEQKAAAIRRIQSGCKSATGLMKDICTVVGGG